MEPYTIRFSPEAAEFFRDLELFRRLPLVDLFDGMRTGRIPKEEYGEVSAEGELTQVLLIKEFAVSYQIDDDSNTVFVTHIHFADDGTQNE